MAVSVGRLLTLERGAAGGWGLDVETSAPNLAWWQTPALELQTPVFQLLLPFLPSVVLLLSALGVGLGGATVLLLLLPNLGNRRRGGVDGSSTDEAASGAATAAASVVAGTTSAGVAPTVAVAAIGAGCCAGSTASAGVVVAASAGPGLLSVVFSMLAMDLVQITILWLALLVQEQELQRRRDRTSAHEDARPSNARRSVGMLVLRVALATAGLTGILAMFIDWSTVSPTDAGAALWYHWLFEDLLLSLVALAAALFPRGLGGVIERARTRFLDLAALWEIRGALVVAGVTWGTFVPPVLVAAGLGGLGNALLGYWGVPTPWASPYPGPLTFALLFHWVVQHALLSAFALAVALRPGPVLRFLGGLESSSRTSASLIGSGSGRVRGAMAGSIRRSHFGKESQRGSLVLLVAALMIGAGVVVVLYATQTPGGAYLGQVRTYYVAADEVEWNYTPSGMNEISGEPFGVGNATELQYTARNATYLGTTLLKCVYRQYTDASFSQQVTRSPGQAYLGILGPVLYAVVGDTLKVVFQNHCRFPESIDPQGFASTSQDAQGASVAPGLTFTYTWYAAPSMGPAALQPPSTLWIYSSGTSPANATDAGLVGPILVTSPGEANPNGTPIIPNIIDAFAIFGEGSSPYLGQNILDHAEDPAEVFPNESNPNWQESLNKYSINGYLYGNQPLVTLVRNETYEWDLFDVGNDMHAAHWHGNTVVYDGTITDVVTLLPDQTAEAVMVPDDPGIWLFHCHVDDHLAGGMITRYQVMNSTVDASESMPVPGAAQVPAAPSASGTVVAVVRPGSTMGGQP